MRKYEIYKPTKEEILTSYNVYGASISKLAKQYNTSNPTVRKWMVEYGIERKTQKQASTEANNRNKILKKPSKEEFEELYQNSSIKDIENFYGVSQKTVYEWLDFYKINIKTHSDACNTGKKKQFKRFSVFNKEYLQQNYDHTKPMNYNAEKLNVSYSFLKTKMKEYDIKIEPTWRSNGEIKLYEFCRETFPEYAWVYCDKSIINPFEIDIVNHDKKIAIEYCGLYWHSETFGGKDKKYHANKRKLCREKGYKLITVFDTDDFDKITNIIKNAMGGNEKIYARDTIIKTIPSNQANVFMTENHIHGFVGATYHYGVFKDDELFMAMSFGKSRYDKSSEYEIIRMASRKGYTVIGGASKLFKKFIKEINPTSVTTFADLRFGEGEVYRKMGFEYVGFSEPNYWYFNKNNASKIHSRVKFQKHKLEKILDNFDPSLTEYQNMLNNSWDRIWDCGNNKYQYKNETNR